MQKNKLLVDKTVRIEKYPGKGGWHYCRLPEIPMDKGAPFGWVRVKGTIDDFEIKAYHLMPMGNGELFLPIKTEIRRKIQKREKDFVRVVLWTDDTPIEIPDELKLCLTEEPKAYEQFLKCRESEKNAIIKWIYSAKKEETKVNRIAKTMDILFKKKIR